MERLNVASRDRLWLRFFAGLFYLALLSVWFSAAVAIGVLSAFALLLAGAAVSIVLVLTWLTLWARRNGSQLGQFQIGSFFFLTALVAMLFATVRWSVGRIVSYHHLPDGDILLFAVVTMVWLVAIAVSFPFVLGMAEAVLWASVWALRQPIVRQAIAGLFQTRWQATRFGRRDRKTYGSRVATRIARWLTKRLFWHGQHNSIPEHRPRFDLARRADIARGRVWIEWHSCAARDPL